MSKKRIEMNRSLTQEEFEKVNSFNRKMYQMHASIGALEIQKVAIVNDISSLRREILEYETHLREKYGNISIDLSTGKINDYGKN